VLVFFPYLLFLPWCALAVRHDTDTRRWWWASLATFFGTLGFASAFFRWWGGYSLGPRLMTEAAPFLALLFVPIWQRWRDLGRIRVPFAASVVFAAATQVLFAYSPQAFAWDTITDEHLERLWSVRNSQIAAAWVPGWRPPLDVEEITGDSRSWSRVDLSRIANARYDLDPFTPGSPPTWSRYPRLLAERFNTPRSLFHVTPGRVANAVTTCRGASPAAVPIPSFAVSRIHALMSAGATEGFEGTPVIASLELKYADGAGEKIPIRLNVNVYDYEPERRAAGMDPRKIYWGRANENDVLVKSTFPVSHRNAPLVSVRLLPEPALAPAGVSLLALTLER
jgi:hypothetical protein